MSNASTSKLLELEKIKNVLFPKEEDMSLQEIEDDVLEVETVKDNTQVVVSEQGITKEDVVDNLVRLNTASEEILEHLKDIVLSELPESQKITETSSIINAITNINKAIYDMKFKNQEEVVKDAKQKLNSQFIKELINEVRNKKN